ncbi:MAG: tetratricopeptide repeat protein [Gammaproteobacteria bacterium]
MPSHTSTDPYQTAMALAEQGRFDQARSALASIISDEPKHLPARFALAGLLSEAGELDAAIPHYLVILEQEPEHLESHLALAGILYRQRRYANAEGAYQHVLTLSPNHLDAQLGLSRCQWRLNKQDLALETLRDLIAKKPDALEAWHLLAQLAARSKNWPETLLACDALLNANEADDRITLQRGLALAMLKQWQAAESAFQSITEQNAENEQAWIGLAASQAAQAISSPEKLKQARQSSRAALNARQTGPISKNDVVVLRNLGQDHFQLSPHGSFVLQRENNIDDHLDGLPVHEIYLEQLAAKPKLKQDIAKAGLIINAVSDPERSPDALEKITSLLEQWNKPVINPPDRVALCTRDNNHLRLKDLPGLVFPKTTVITPSKLKSSNEGQDFPYILRRVGTHMGASMARIDNAAQRDEFLATADNAPHYLIEYIDNPFRPGVYRRLRIMCVGGRKIAIGCHYHQHWNVHSSDRGEVMFRLPELQQEEQRFVSDHPAYLGETGTQAIDAISQVVGLDYFGIDFDILPDGRLLIFEVNAAMAPNAKVLKDFPYLKPAFAELRAAVRQLIGKPP